MKHRYSDLYTYFKCPKLYELTKIKHLPDGSDKNGDLLFGTAVHLAVEDLFSGGEGVGVFNLYWSTLPKDIEYGKLKHDVLAEMGPQLIEIFRDEHMKNIVPEHVEKRIESHFLFGEDTITVGGTPDCLGLYKGVPSVIDYKTSAMPYNAYKGFVNEQMYLYASMAEREHNFKAQQGVYVVFVKDPKNPRIQIKVHEFVGSIVKERTDNALAVFRQIESTSIFPRNSGACSTYAGLCPLYKECYENKE